MSDKEIKEELCCYFNRASVYTDFYGDGPTDIGDCDTGLFIIKNSTIEQLSDEEFKLLDNEARQSELGMSFESCEVKEKETGITVKVEKSVNLHFGDDGLPNGEGTLSHFSLQKLN